MGIFTSNTLHKTQFIYCLISSIQWEDFMWSILWLFYSIDHLGCYGNTQNVFSYFHYHLSYYGNRKTPFQTFIIVANLSQIYQWPIIITWLNYKRSRNVWLVIVQVICFYQETYLCSFIIVIELHFLFICGKLKWDSQPQYHSYSTSTSFLYSSYTCSTVVLYRGIMKVLEILARNYHPKTSLIFKFWHFSKS